MAEIGRGALHFKATLDNTSLQTAIEESITKIRDMSMDMGVSAGDMQTSFDSTADGINKAFNIIDQAVGANKQAVAKLREEYEKIGQEARFRSKKIGESGEMTARQREIKKEVEARQKLVEALGQESDALVKLERKVELSKTAQNTLTREIRNTERALAEMRANGIPETSAEYKKLAQELGRLRDIQGDIKTQGRILSNDQAQFQGIISGLQGVTGGFGAVMGAMTLFSSENEELQRILLKVNSLMTITMSLQQVSQAINKDSAFRLVTLNKAKEWWVSISEKARRVKQADTIATAENTTAITAQTVAQGKASVATTTQATAQAVQTASAGAGTVANWSLAAAFRAVGLAIKSIPVFGWILAGVSALIGLVSHFSKEAKEAKEETEKFNAKVSELATKPIQAFEKLRREWVALGNDMDAKNKMVERSKEEFENLGMAVNSVADAERMLTNPESVERFRQAMIAKAKAMAVQEKLAEVYRKQIELELKGEEMVKVDNIQGKNGKTYYQLDRATTIADGEKQYKYTLEHYQDFQKLKKEEEDLAKLGNKYTNEHLENAKAIGLSTDEAKTKKQWSETKQRIKGVADAMRTRREEERKLLEEYRKGLQEELKDSQNILAKLQLLEERKRQLNDGDKLREEKAKILAEQEGQALEAFHKEQEQIRKAHESYLEKKVAYEKKYLNDLAILREAERRAEDETERKAIARTIEARKRAFEEGMQKGAYDPEIAKAIEAQRTLADKREQIEKDYLHKIAQAREDGNEKAIAGLEKLKEEEMKALALDELKENPLYEKLFGDLSEIAPREIEKIIALFEEHKLELSARLSPTDYDKIKGQVLKLHELAVTHNPFTAFLRGFKAYTKATEQGQATQAINQMVKASGQIGGIMREGVSTALSALDSLGVGVSDTTQETINNIGQMASGIGSLAKGIATANPLSIAQGAASVISSGLKMITSIHDSKHTEAIRKHQEEVTRLQEQYQRLGVAVDKALGQEKYQQSQALINNLKAQQRHLEAMKREEANKKKSDKRKIEEYQQQQRNNAREIEEHIDTMRNKLLGSELSSIATGLGEAMVQAFAKGEDGAKAWGKKVDDIVSGIIRRMLVQKLVEERVGKIIQSYSDRWVKKDGTFIGMEAVIRESQQMGEDLKRLTEQLAPAMRKAMEAVPGLMEAQGMGESGTLAGQIKGVTEETASLVAGHMNAIRLNQIETTATIRQQLLHLANIESYARHLESIDNKLTKRTDDETLRSMGIV